MRLKQSEITDFNLLDKQLFKKCSNKLFAVKTAIDLSA